MKTYEHSGDGILKLLRVQHCPLNDRLSHSLSLKTIYVASVF